MRKRKTMNKKQFIVMWVAIVLISLILVFPAKQNEAGRTRRRGGSFWDSWEIPVTRTKLCLIASATAVGLIITFKGKKSKDKQE